MPKKPLRKKHVIVPCRYLVDAKSNEHKYHVSRTLDCEAIDIARAALVSMGHTGGRSIYFQPPRQPQAPDAPTPTVPLERLLSPEMLLLYGSRPPIFEDKWSHPKIRKSSHHELEPPFVDAWRRFFRKKRRDVLELAGEAEARLTPEVADRSYIEFRTSAGSFYKRLAGSARRLPPEPRTCGFVLNLSDFYQGASLTSFFAMDGLACLIMSTLIAERHPGWLDEPGFRMVEMIGTPIPDAFQDLDFVDDWEIVTLVHFQA